MAIDGLGRRGAVEVARGARRAAEPAPPTYARRRAAEELGLRPGELELAVLMEEVRAVSVPGPGRWRVPGGEVARLRASDGFPESLRGRLRVVGTAEAAEAIGLASARFTRLARVGCFSPVRFRINRYRAVVWHYAAVEIEAFAGRHPELLRGRTPPALRAMLDAGEDWRARNWRSRRMGQLVRQTDDPWSGRPCRRPSCHPTR